MSRLCQYITEGKKLIDPMIGLSVKSSDVKRISKYIESWLIRYDFPYDAITDYHLTISQIIGKYNKDKLVRAMHDIKTDYTMTPVGIKILRGKRVPKDFIVIEYSPVDTFIQSIRNVSDEFKTFKFPKIMPHISLFMVKQGVIDDKLLKELVDKAPKLKKIKPISVALWNTKHEKVYGT